MIKISLDSAVAWRRTAEFKFKIQSNGRCVRYMLVFPRGNELRNSAPHESPKN